MISDGQIVALVGTILGTLVSVVSVLFLALKGSMESRLADRKESESHAWQLVTDLLRDRKDDNAVIERLTEAIRELKQTRPPR